MENARVSLIWQGAASEASLSLPLRNTGARLHVKGGRKKIVLPTRNSEEPKDSVRWDWCRQPAPTIISSPDQCHCRHYHELLSPACSC